MSTFEINLTPYWENQPNTVLEIVCYKTSVYTFDVSISGPGIDTNTPITFPSNVTSGVKQVTIPIANKGETLTYKIDVITNSSSLDGQVQNSLEIGTKPNGDAITYQGFLFTNDEGNDKDWNDCVVNLALYNSSSD